MTMSSNFYRYGSFISSPAFAGEDGLHRKPGEGLSTSPLKNKRKLLNKARPRRGADQKKKNLTRRHESTKLIPKDRPHPKRAKSLCASAPLREPNLLHPSCHRAFV